MLKLYKHEFFDSLFQYLPTLEHLVTYNSIQIAGFRYTIQCNLKNLINNFTYVPVYQYE